MMENFYTILFGLSMIMCSCEHAIEFDVASENLIVVDGIVSNEDSRVILTRSSSFDRDSSGYRIINDALVTVENQNGDSWDFLASNNSNIYYPPHTFQAQPGNTYVLTVQIGEKVIKSYPETMHETVPFGLTSSYTERDILTDLNTIDTRYGHDIFAEFVTDIPEDTYLKWQFEQTYENPYSYIDYFTSSTTFNVLATNRLIQSNVRSFNLYFQINQNQTWSIPFDWAIDVEDLEPDDYSGTLNEENAQEIIDSLMAINNEYLFKNFDYTITVSQSSITKEAYQYWSEIKVQKQNTGSIFDAIPATISGNLYVEGSSETVLGYFSASNKRKENIILYYKATRLR